ncbi:hypothetical protein FB567DRAFT_499647 [Paraphoma chrysanthemicola]|uniref:Rhodopsin domain-containing protein n=1 Tax=Paraphoma chrysanthemicola TaxID=798071 RepID=A0A8K0R1B9_9PLEO|nr:hypothetical protein FB567DRAFT_499647 [Paraphoma chrysanthemicola]
MGTTRFPTAAEFASFPRPNYVDPITRRPVAIAVTVPLTVLVITAISCRFYGRIVIVRKLGWDDWTMLVAAILCVANNIMLVVAMLPNYQLGYHYWDLKLEVMNGTMKAAQVSMAYNLIFTAIAAIMKVSILLTYLMLFPSMVNKWFCRTMIAYTIVLNVIAFFITIFQCSPASAYWEPLKYLGTAKCMNLRAIYYYHNAQNTLSDFIIFLWPVKDLMNVKISLRQRITLTCMFSLGVIVCIAGVLHIYYTYIYLESFDVMWHGATCFIVGAVESCVGVACGCLPGCKPLMSKLFPRVFGATTQNSHSRRYAYAHDRGKQLEAGRSQRSDNSDSYKLRSVSIDEIDLIVPARTRGNSRGPEAW